MKMWTVDPRFTDETLAFVNFIMQQSPPTGDLDVEKRRQGAEEIHAKINERLIGTFKGTSDEQKVKANATGVDSSAKVGLAGESAGANMCASLCKLLKNIDFQILVYGIYDLLRKAPSYQEFTKPMYFLTPETLDWLTASSFGDMKDLTDHRVSLLTNSSLEGLPPCLLIVAELDPLRDDSYAYQKLLEQAGVSAKLVLIKGVIHAFFSLPGTYTKACAEVITNVQEFMASL